MVIKTYNNVVVLPIEHSILNPYEKGKDFFAIELISMVECENIAGMKVIFKPIAGDYSKAIRNVVITKGKYEGILSYVVYARNKKELEKNV